MAGRGKALVGLLALALALAPAFAGATVAPRHVAATETFQRGILRVEHFGTVGYQPIVFVPALFCGSWEWNAQIDALSATYDVYVVTLPGFDGIPMVSGDALMQRAVQSLHELVRRNHLYHAIVVGHSLGGTVAVDFAQTYPHDPGLVVTVEGGYPVAPTQAARDAAVAQSVRPYVGIGQSALGPALRQNMLQYTIQSKADVATVEALAAKSDPAAIVAWMRAALTLDLTPGLHAIAVPFVAIVPYDATIDPFAGYKTASAKRAAYAAWVANAPHGDAILIDNARHFVMFDRPDAFERALLAAIARPV